jgi:hypothetical protein
VDKAGTVDRAGTAGTVDSTSQPLVILSETDAEYPLKKIPGCLIDHAILHHHREDVYFG